MHAIERSLVKASKCSPSSPEQQNRSTVKRLFSSVFSILDNDQEISQFEYDQQSSRIERLLQNSNFVAHLHNKMSNQSFFEGYKFPILRLTLQIHDKYFGLVRRAQLDESDIHNLASKFGQLNRVFIIQDKTQAYIFFNSIFNAYICSKLLKAIKFRSSSNELNIDWVHNCGYHPDVSNEVHHFINQIKYDPAGDNLQKQQLQYGEEGANQAIKQNKFTCRFEIQIENERQFQVARRIIGPKGCNMKKIIEESVTAQQKSASDNVNELLKLRLRGKGSGYKEGPEQQQSSQNLHLCVSAKDQVVYNQACQKVQKLLTVIYSDYSDFTRRQGKTIELTIKKIMLGQGLGMNDESNGINYNDNYGARNDIQSEESSTSDEAYRISPQKISQLLEMRNKARRELNFMEADRIRNYLRSVGVCLIDEKGRRGKAADVTTWKYIY